MLADVQHQSQCFISRLKDLSEYINSELAEESAKLSIKDRAGVSHSCSRDDTLML